MMLSSAFRKTYPHLFFLIIVLLAGCSDDQKAIEDGAITTSRDSEKYQNWQFHGHSNSEQRFSPLAQLTTKNIHELSLSWYFDLPNDGGVQATPIIMDGVMYVTAAWSRVYALDAENGKLLWQFDPEVPRETLVKACCGPVNRGVAYEDGRVFVGTFDGRLISLDAKTGNKLWSVVTVDQSSNYTITGAPRIADGKVYIGNGGGEFGVRGYVSAYDSKTGQLLWRFYTVPGNPDEGFENPAMAMAAKTWFGEWWKVGGGGTVWDSMAYDPELDILYIGVGNGSPWNPNIRSQGKGDNLFVSSIVALNASTGEYIWHYQTTPGEGWDYTATQHIVLAESEIEGESRKLLLQAPKNGFFYVLDRITGELISAEPYVNVNWATHVDQKTGRPQITDAVKYWQTGEMSLVLPGALGAHTWHPMAFDPRTKTVFIPAQEIPQAFKANDDEAWSEIGLNIGLDASGEVSLDPENLNALRSALKGKLIAWDPIKQQANWQVDYPHPNNGGLLATQGDLLFQGTLGGLFKAYNSFSGELLWEFDAQTSVMAAPSSYSIKGRQYVAVGAGSGGAYVRSTSMVSPETANPARILVFSSGGNAKLPEVSPRYLALPDTSHLDIEAATAKKGVTLYARFCTVCHGVAAVSGVTVPDLRYSAFIQSKEAWQEVVINGVLAEKGMVSFAQALTDKDAEAIRQYVIQQNRLSHQFGDKRKVIPYRVSL